MSLKDIIFLNIHDYMSTEPDFYVNIVVLVMGLALCVASFFINHHKRYTVNFIKALLRRNATSEQNAKTLAQLHFSGTFSLRRALSRSGQLTKIVKRVGQPNLSYEEYMALSKEERKGEKIDFSTAAFFISPEEYDRAVHIKERENPTVIRTLLVCVFIVAMTVCVMMLMPSLLSFIYKTA